MKVNGVPPQSWSRRRCRPSRPRWRRAALRSMSLDCRAPSSNRPECTPRIVMCHQWWRICPCQVSPRQECDWRPAVAAFVLFRRPSREATPRNWSAEMSRPSARRTPRALKRLAMLDRVTRVPGFDVDGEGAKSEFQKSSLRRQKRPRRKPANALFREDCYLGTPRFSNFRRGGNPCSVTMPLRHPSPKNGSR